MQIDRPIAIAVILFIVLLVVFFLVMPEYKTFKILRVELGEKTAEYNAKYEYYAAIDNVYEILQSRQDDLKKIDDALPKNPELGKMVYLLQKIAAENNIIIKDLYLSKAAASNESNVKDISFSMNLLGSYSSLGKFLVALERSTRLFEVTSISFGSASKGSTSSAKSTAQTQLKSQATSSFGLQIETHSY